MLKPINRRRFVEKDPFSGGNKLYHRVVTGGAEVNVLERWPMGEAIFKRLTRVVDGDLRSISILYPSGTDADPNSIHMVVSVGFSLKNFVDPLEKAGSIRVFKASEEGKVHQVAKYNNGVFSRFSSNSQPGMVLMRDGRLALFQGAGNKETIGGLLDREENSVRIFRRVDSTMMENMLFPFEFQYDKLVHLILGSGVSSFREAYPVNYFLTKINQEEHISSPLDLRLFVLPRERALVDICLANGWFPQASDVVGLVGLQEKVMRGQRSEQIPLDRMDQNRFEFGKWLVKHGRLSEDLASQLT